MILIIKKYKKLMFMSMGALLFLNSNFMNIKSKAVDNGMLLYGSEYRVSQGSNYWHTSNLREWLNSEGIVPYTNAPPTSNYLDKFAYDKEQGFLSNFSEIEKKAIAVTNLNTTLTPNDAFYLEVAGSQMSGVFNTTKSVAFNMPNMINYWNSLAQKRFNDKVFLLSPKELAVYYQQRGWNVTKELTPEVRQKYTLTSTIYAYHTRSARTEGLTESMIAVTNNPNSVVSESNPNKNIGVSPAMHLKPNNKVNVVKEYNVNNTKDLEWKSVNKVVDTQNLNIGDIIEFGTYLGKSIEWRVVNFSENGYPLIVTEKLIDIKAYDSPGDRAYANSNISFQTADTTSNDDYFYNVQKTEDRNIPQFRIVNETELYSRQNGSFSLLLEATDESGISRIILPDGSVYNNPPKTFNYTVSDNGYYLFKIVDNKGNYKMYVIPVGNINLETQVMVNQSDTNWTNSNVNVNIKASNDVNFYSEGLTINARDYFGFNYPNYTSYAGKKFKISADVELLYANKPVGNITTGIGFHYYYTSKSGDDYVRSPQWVYAKQITLADLQQNGKKHIEVEYTVPGNYYNNLITWSQIDVDHTERAYAVRYSNVKYELIDNDDFAITKIELPNGQIVNNKEYDYTISTEGEVVHNYKIHDNRNMINNKSITTKIDKTKPIINISEIPNTWTNKNVSLDFSFVDTISGIKEIVTPFEDFKLSGDKSFNKTVTFEKNGLYSFKIVDLAGNETIKTINISNIDTVAPIINVSKEINNNKLSGYLNISIIENGELSEVLLPDGIKSSASNIKYPIQNNGLYLITAIDKAGNIGHLSINVTELEKANIISSGISKIEYKLTGATTQDWTVYTTAFYIKNEGITYITARSFDKAGNISNEETSYVKIDKTKPINNGIKIELTK